jgi:hypothetical protein
MTAAPPAETAIHFGKGNEIVIDDGGPESQSLFSPTSESHISIGTDGGGGAGSSSEQTAAPPAETAIHSGKGNEIVIDDGGPESQSLFSPTSESYISIGRRPDE